MIYIISFSIFFLFSVCFLTTFLAFKYLKLSDEKKKLENYIVQIINSIKSVRYGDFNSRANEGYNPLTKKLSASLNHTFESISDREMMIREYIERDRENSKLKTDFIATLTHDLKVPIIAQDNTFELFLNNKFGELSEIQYEAIKNLKISNMDLKHLVETLLETFKMEQSATKLNITKDVVVSELISDCISQIKSILILHKKEVNFINNTINLKADLDIFLTKRVLQNLILNALWHSIHSDKVDIILDADDKELQISIKDYGVGIDKAEIKKIFNKYYSSNSKFAHSGVGLGLYLSNKIIKLHNGRIEVDSKKDQGSVFKVILPVYTEI